MIKLVTLFFLAAYIAPLVFLLGSYGLDQALFVVSYGSAGLLVAATVVMFAGGHNRRGRSCDHARMFEAPRVLIWGTMACYIILRFPDIVTMFQGLKSGNLASLMLANAVERYSGYSTGPSARSQIGLITLFMFFTFWGSRSGHGNGRQTYAYAAFALFAFFVESLGLARAGILLAILCFAVEYVIRNNQKLYRASFPKYLKYSVPIVFVLLGVYFFSAYLRVLGKEDAFGIALNKLSLYTIASHDFFLIWLRDSESAMGGGFFTFTFIWKLLGVDTEQGFYAPITGQFGTGNIYLNIRGFIEDFGVVGAIGVIGAIMLQISVLTFRKIGPIGYLSLRVCLALILFPIYSPFYFTVFAAAFLFSGVVLVTVAPRSRELTALRQRPAEVFTY